ncbi:hypothetical protein COCSUDRAFT_59969 [Coccomyxa subellipsoidea C-169]|uniref:UVR domain-containing protein n=1 Tax=Coccomyxa subellipsoidea (strain C-169) TaxID=574566 RepID=I0YJU1_COCSC|nr:hypothetical protein COCSUDRAFT_59969 [Coccomyxa subellipsoidea C-169]EIE18660.1 hypothetical protein COCSUDRAFT_59969 [Coccomyxa subellipsoidea C-169]|eukprot:XP_005643204.1 hypothetical protein COCSUDRAFT_59969 [Coccomyxa subellipsoidea C-169]
MSIRASVTERTEEVPLADLQVMLEDAVRQEDYQAAAELRDELMYAPAWHQYHPHLIQVHVLQAMNDIWGQGEHVQCIHPAAACIAGRQNVMESWRVILRGAPMTISLEDVRVYAGDAAAYVTCIEVMDAGDSRGRDSDKEN